MRVLALDIGEKRIGVAVSDPAGRVATPLAVLDTRQVLGDGVPLKRVLDEYEPDAVIVGLPLSMDGTEGPQARRIRALAGKMAHFLPMEIEFVDERLSSSEAKRRMSEGGATEKRMRGSVDMVAAAILLQGHLDSASGEGRADDEER